MIEDNRNALFSEPNAFIQHYPKRERKPREKIVFSEPYECAPNFYFNNNFKKHDCECVPCSKNRDRHNNEHCNNVKVPSCEPCHNHHSPNTKPMFDFKSILPMLTGLFQGKSGLGDFSKILSSVGSDSKNQGFDFQNIISSLMSNPSMLNGIFKMLSPTTKKASSNLNKEKNADFVIKNYTRV